jgi:two-component system, NarL family, nitrate/nitrite response regulator NarL
MCGMRVLLVDDHQGFLRAAVALLESEGMEVVGTAESGTAALAALDRCTPDVVLLDYVLPDLDGVEVAFAIRQRPDPPAVILISSYTEAASDPRVRGAAVNGFLAKQELTCTAIRDLID